MSQHPRPAKPEIMSPAGHWPQLRAAVEAGADAVYFGLRHFTARAKAGFSLAELPEAMQTLHSRGVKGYVTFNTLVFDHELEEAVKTLTAIAETGADAIIVQDVAIAQLASRIAPDLDVHGSTQMSITSAEGIRLAQQFGVRRVVLARELSLDEIRTIRGQTDCELEMFVHGALCVSYSGQCLSSEAWGGRSANRGQCAQACRLPYELMVDGHQRPLGDARYLLSPGDLYALRQMPEIVQIGVSALKIEGRYKDADYVALTTRAYRQAVDEAWAGLPVDIDRRAELQLEQVYSRGLGAHFITGTNHQAVVDGRSPRHRGVMMGRVARVLPDRVLVAPDAEIAALAPLKPGDGLVFDAADWRSPQEPEEGGRVYHVQPARGGLELSFGNGEIDFARIRPGDWVWRTHDPELDKEVRPLLQPAAPVRKQPLRLRVRAHEGAPLTMEWTLLLPPLQQPQVATIVCSEAPLASAQNRPLTVEFVREQCGRLGGTPYVLEQVELDVRGRPFVPSSLLNQLRRQAVEQLRVQQSAPRPHAARDPLAELNEHLAQAAGHASAAQASGISDPLAQLHLLVRTPEQLEAALALRPASITLDYLDLYGLRPAVERVQAAGVAARVASPRVLKPNEQRIVNFLLRLDCQILVRSTGLLHALRSVESPAHHGGAADAGGSRHGDGSSHGDGSPYTGDFSLNAANVLAADTFLRLGLRRITPGHDLNAAQVADLARVIGAHRVEVVAYQHLPVFHTEHCVFCRFLSTGTTYKDCGHPCEKHRVALRDDHGRAHPVMADVGCRNTVFGAQAQEASQHLDAWRRAGIRHFRLEFVHENADQVTAVSQAIRDTLDGRLSAPRLSQRLRELAPEGTTEGSLFVADNYLALPLL